MPKILLTVPETELSVTRPVVFDITRQLMKDTGISDKTTISYPGFQEQNAQPNSLISDSSESDMFPFNDRITVEVQESYTADRILSEAAFEPEHLFVFRDDKIMTTIKPVYSMADIVINIKFRAADSTSAKRWRDDMRARIGMMKDERYHTVSYHYLIPPEFIYILNELHRMREAVEGYGDTIDQYLKNHLTTNASILTNLAGKQGQWGVAETQQRIVGYFDFDPTPDEGSKEDEGDTSTTTVAYKFSYEKPIACAMSYPLVIHNQLLSERFRPSEQLPDPAFAITSRTASMMAWEPFEVAMSKGLIEGIAVPYFDEFIPSSVPAKTKRLVTMMTTLDPVRPNMLLTPEEWASIGLNPVILAFMKKEAPFMTRRYQSVLQLDLYRNGNIVPQDMMEMNGALQLMATEALSLRDNFHVRFSVVEDLRLLPPAAIDRIRQNGAAAQIILDYLAPWLSGVGLIPEIIIRDIIGRQDLEAAIDTINSGIISNGNGQGYQINTVNSIFVQAFKGQP